MPEDFQYGGGNIDARVALDGTNYELSTDWFRIENPFMERSNGKQVAIGNWWSSKYFDGPQYVNSTDETITFNGVTIDAQTIQIADGRIYTFDEFDAIRQNLGIEPHSTRFDDYIDISSYKIEDFPNTGEWHFADIEATIGNDIYVDLILKSMVAL